jgi:hypothetical protein
MGSRPLEIARNLGVTPEDAQTIKASRRKAVLSRIAQVGVTILAALAGFAAGKATSPHAATQPNEGYPYASLLSTPVLLAGSSRRSWIAAVIVAVVAFMTFFIISTDMSSGTYGVGIKYGVHHRK